MKKPLLVISSLSVVLWVFPAILSFGNAITYLTNPNMPPDMKAHWVNYLWSGIFFSSIGIMNIVSILYLIYRLRRP